MNRMLNCRQGDIANLLEVLGRETRRLLYLLQGDFTVAAGLQPLKS